MSKAHTKNAKNNAADNAVEVSRLLKELASADNIGAKKRIRRKLRSLNAYVSRMTPEARDRAMNAKRNAKRAKDASNAKDVAKSLASNAKDNASVNAA